MVTFPAQSKPKIVKTTIIANVNLRTLTLLEEFSASGTSVSLLLSPDLEEHLGPDLKLFPKTPVR